jgi:hypothetical protein
MWKDSKVKIIAYKNPLPTDTTIYSVRDFVRYRSRKGTVGGINMLKLGPVLCPFDPVQIHITYGSCFPTAYLIISSQ